MTNLLPCTDLIAAGWLICISCAQTLEGSPALPGNVGVLLGVFETHPPVRFKLLSKDYQTSSPADFEDHCNVLSSVSRSCIVAGVHVQYYLDDLKTSLPVSRRAMLPVPWQTHPLIDDRALSYRVYLILKWSPSLMLDPKLAWDISRFWGLPQRHTGLFLITGCSCSDMWRYTAEVILGGVCAFLHVFQEVT